ncbi:threonine-phosphate decarboxylase [Treponema primitia ZAS-2]|uniref:threonine-phosphate decarboxylase n=1 Tax=Treponema primitia (strain ATCC BAA-887 / DSM 12427 / ZAS-2) TaxID=545694 RepID=F5YLB4_TREPZ|nr:threonine-phosphate decarboxylase CobD [Treponema primitia]AEF84311.1 threonine-phosphate decarboxylase [Treponema primitia ZAS-2]
MLHGGDIYSHEQLIEKDREGLFLDYSVNTNPLGMPPSVREAICAHVDEYQRYPDPSCRALRAGLSTHEGVSEDRIYCGNGAADLIFRLCLARKPRRALICAPTFSEYERAVKLAGGETVFHYLKEAEGFALGRRFLEDLSPGLDMAFLCNPNNPTGRLIDQELLADILRRCREFRILLVMDECFLPFTPAESLAENLGSSLVVLKAFTKTFSMAGLRLGYILAADAALIATVADTGQCWSVSAPAQAAGLVALECTGWVEQSRAVIDTEREFLSYELRDAGFNVFDSDANFLLFCGAASLKERLIGKGVLIRNCSNFHGLDEHYYRVCVKQREQNERLMAAIREVLDEQKN